MKTKWIENYIVRLQKKNNILNKHIYYINLNINGPTQLNIEVIVHFYNFFLK